MGGVEKRVFDNVYGRGVEKRVFDNVYGRGGGWRREFLIMYTGGGGG